MQRGKKALTVLTGGSKNTFTDALNHFDNKRYQKGLQLARRLRKLHPTNGEVCALEGLLLHVTGLKEQGYALAKQGLRIAFRLPDDQRQITCPFTYRTYGLMYLEDKDYENSKKSFLGALRYDSDNEQILKDLANVQSHLGDWQGALKYRLKLMELKGTESSNWLHVAFALRMVGRCDTMARILDQWMGFQDHEISIAKTRMGKSKKIVEKSRVQLFKYEGLFEAKEYERVLSDTETNHGGANRHKEQIVFLRGKCLLELGRPTEARDCFIKVLRRNCGSHEYVRYLQKATVCLRDDDLLKEGVYTDPEEISQLMQLYASLASEFPRAKLFRRIPLTLMVVSEDDDSGVDDDDPSSSSSDSSEASSVSVFRDKFLEFVVPFLRKTVPPMFEAIKNLSSCPAKSQIMEKALLELRSRLLETKKLFPEQEQQEPPSTLLWVVLCLARLCDRVGRFDEALAFVDECLEHTPSSIEICLVRGRILKHMDRLPEALESVNEAAEMDLADRFLNTKRVKYLLMNHRIAEALKRAKEFAFDREGAFNLHEYQGVRFETRLAKAYFGVDKIGLALREFHRVRHFASECKWTHADYYDFVFRHCALKEALDHFRRIQNLRFDTYYGRSTFGMMRCYLRLHEIFSESSKMETEGETTETEGETQTTETDFRSDARCNASEEEVEAYFLLPADLTEMEKLVHGTTEGEKKKPKTEYALDRALEMYLELEEIAPRDVRTYVLGITLFGRKSSPLGLLRAVRKLQQLDASHAEVEVGLARVREILESGTLQETAREVVESELAKGVGVSSDE